MQGVKTTHVKCVCSINGNFCSDGHVTDYKSHMVKCMVADLAAGKHYACMNDIKLYHSYTSEIHLPGHGV